MASEHVARERSFPLRSRSPHETALITSSQTLSVGEVTHAALDLCVRIKTSHTQKYGIGSGRRPCVVVPSSNAGVFLVGILACSFADAVAVPWRNRTLPLEQITDIVHPDFLIQSVDGIIDRCSVVDLGLDQVRGVRHGDLLVMTSGSTGLPKSVALNFSKVVLNASTAGCALGIWRCTSWAVDIDLALMSALSHMFMAWQFCIPFVYLEHVESKDTTRFLDNAFGYGGSPLQMVRLRDRLAKTLNPRLVVSSGDFFTPQMVTSVMESLPSTEIHKFYGLTEIGGRFCHLPHEVVLDHKAAAGFPLPGFKVRISSQSDDSFGLVHASSPLLAEGYYVRGGLFEPIASQWFATGDLGKMESNGLITLVGRSDDVFKVGGEKVSRVSIEDALAQLLVNQEYCVLPIEHDVLGQCPTLFFSPKEGEEPPRWSDIVRHLRGLLPSRFIPSLMYAVRGGLPRLPSGKLDRVTLTQKHRSFEVIK